MKDAPPGSDPLLSRNKMQLITLQNSSEVPNSLSTIVAHRQTQDNVKTGRHICLPRFASSLAPALFAPLTTQISSHPQTTSI